MELNQSKIPSRSRILKYLEEAKKNNKGPWDQHSLRVGEAAKLIASRCSDLDEDLAYALGALHDIGRREGISHMHHVIAGYNFMKQEGYDKVARICLTHSFPNQEIREYFGERDCSFEELNFIEDYITNVEYDDYDKLIQLCDALSLTTGFCLMEKRMIDVALRYGVSDYTQEKWKACFSLKEYFEDKIGTSIYSILPNVIENTFK